VSAPMFAGSGERAGTPTSSPRGVSAVGRNINARNENGLFSRHKKVRRRRADDATRLTLVGLSRLIDWRHLCGPQQALLFTTRLEFKCYL
jgi:hypothetical protein